MEQLRLLHECVHATCGAANKYTAWAKVAGAAARRGAAEQVRLSTAVAGGACDAMNSQRYACRRKGKADVAYLAYDDATLSEAQRTHTTATWGADVWGKWGACKSHCGDGECVPPASGRSPRTTGGRRRRRRPRRVHPRVLAQARLAGGRRRARAAAVARRRRHRVPDDRRELPRRRFRRRAPPPSTPGTSPHGGGRQLLVAVGKGGSTAVYSATADVLALVGTAAASCAGAHACRKLGEGQAPGAIAHAGVGGALDAAGGRQLHAATRRCYPKS